MAQAGPDAEADEEVALIRSIRAEVFREKETVKDGDEGSGLLGRGSNDTLNVGVSADRAAQDRVAGCDGRSISTQDGIGFFLEGRKPRVAEKADGGPKNRRGSHASSRIGEGGTEDRLFALAKLEAHRDERGVLGGRFG